MELLDLQMLALRICTLEVKNPDSRNADEKILPVPRGRRNIFTTATQPDQQQTDFAIVASGNFQVGVYLEFFWFMSNSRADT